MPCLGACNLDFHLGDLPEPNEPNEPNEPSSSCDPDGGSSAEPPVLTLIGPAAQSQECRTPYVDPGARATDACFGDLSSSITRTGSVNSNVPASYMLTYNVSNPAGQSATPVTRTVTVIDTQPPTLTLNGPAAVSLECAQPYSDPGVTASDACEGDMSSRISRNGSVNGNVPGSYTLTYAVSDPAGNSTPSVARTVTVSDTLPPTLTVQGSLNVSLECGTAYTDPGASADDLCAGPLPVVATTPPNTSVPGTYTVGYQATDPSGNVAVSSVSRSVVVTDTLPPTLTLNGSSGLTLECAQPFNDPGATAGDQCRGNLTASITRSGAVNNMTPNDYLLRYSVSDGTRTASTDRTVRVRDTQPPTITVIGPLNQTLQCGDTYVDPGATATDACAGNLTSSITATQSGTPDSFTITYAVTDPSGNTFTSPMQRKVTRTGGGKPVLTLHGPNPTNVECKSNFVDPGATATDACYGDLTASILRFGTVNDSIPGAYTLEYQVQNPAGQWADPITRAVDVIDTLPPVLILNGPANVTVECGTPYVDPGATAEDSCAGPIPVTATAAGDPRVPGTYTISYSAADPSGNVATLPVSRTVTVIDTLQPEIQVLPGPSVIECNGPQYVDPGATASDVCYGDLTPNIIVTSDLDQSRAGVYTISYSVMDMSGNVRAASRSITVGPCGLAELPGLSSRLASLATNGTATLEAPGHLVLRGTASALNVFQMNARALRDASRLSIDAPAGSLVVVNILGESVTFAGLERSLHGGIDAHGIVYNFVEATELKLDGSGFWGTVLAPSAHLSPDGWEGGIYSAAGRSGG
jgi:choice-of-anchor A domain-containing protein